MCSFLYQPKSIPSPFPPLMLSVSHLALGEQSAFSFSRSPNPHIKPLPQAFDSPSSSQFSQMNENTMPSRIASCLSFQPLPELESGLHQSIYDDGKSITTSFSKRGLVTEPRSGSYWLYASEQPISDLCAYINSSFADTCLIHLQHPR